MSRFAIDPTNTGTASSHAAVRMAELSDQHWDRAKSLARAEAEGIELSDGHWAVVLFLRDHYLKHGLPTHARAMAKLLNRNFHGLGGGKYLRRLFPRGPVTQGSRFANVRTPACATDLSFGTSY